MVELGVAGGEGIGSSGLEAAGGERGCGEVGGGSKDLGVAVELGVSEWVTGDTAGSC